MEAEKSVPCKLGLWCPKRKEVDHTQKFSHPVDISARPKREAKKQKVNEQTVARSIHSCVYMQLSTHLPPPLVALVESCLTNNRRPRTITDVVGVITYQNNFKLWQLFQTSPQSLTTSLDKYFEEPIYGDSLSVRVMFSEQEKTYHYYWNGMSVSYGFPPILDFPSVYWFTDNPQFPPSCPAIKLTFWPDSSSSYNSNENIPTFHINPRQEGWNCTKLKDVIALPLKSARLEYRGKSNGSVKPRVLVPTPLRLWKLTRQISTTSYLVTKDRSQLDLPCSHDKESKESKEYQPLACNYWSDKSALQTIFLDQFVGNNTKEKQLCCQAQFPKYDCSHMEAQLNNQLHALMTKLNISPHHLLINI